jgi:Transglutaminase-like superfamily
MKPKTIRRTYLREAAVSLLLAGVAVRLVPAARLFAWADRPPRRARRFAADEIGWVLWAIDAAAAKFRSETLCLPRALATHAMLRRRGITSRVCLGVARAKTFDQNCDQDGAEDQIAAHAWVEVGEDRTVASPGAGAFTRIAEFGGSG